MLETLSWDSDFFDFPIARLALDGSSSRAEIEGYLNKHPTALIQTLCELGNKTQIQELESWGFRFVETKVTLRTTCISKDIEPAYYILDADDTEELLSISKGLFEISRYYDPAFPRTLADELYQVWLKKSVVGTFDHEVIAIGSRGNMRGFCTLKYDNNNGASIGLVGIAPSKQGTGQGHLLLQNVIQHVANKPVKDLSVITQGQNVPALNLYIKNGFLIDRMQAWMYLGRL